MLFLSVGAKTPEGLSKIPPVQEKHTEAKVCLFIKTFPYPKFFLQGPRNYSESLCVFVVSFGYSETIHYGVYCPKILAATSPM